MSPPRDPIDRIEEALRDHENKVEQRHLSLLESNSKLYGSLTSLETELRAERSYLRERLDHHHKSLYGDKTEQTPGLEARVRDIEKRRQWTLATMAGAWSVAIAVSGAVLGVLNFFFSK